MARGFGSTYGSGTTDKITTGFSTLSAGKRSYSAWVWIHGTGGGGLGRLMTTSTTENEFWYQSATTYQRLTTGTLGQWQTTTTPSSNTWHHVAITYDGSLVATPPKIYFDGVSQSINTVSSPTGTPITTSNTYLIGNRNDNGRNWDGIIAEFAIWDGVILSQNEMTVLANRVPTRFINPSSIVLYQPLFGLQTNEQEWGPNHLTSTSVSGAKFQPHAPISMWQQPSTINQLASTPAPQPTNTPIIEGLVMIEEGLTILSGLTTNLVKGLIKDELNTITRV